jgi:hypothetical protein
MACTPVIYLYAQNTVFLPSLPTVQPKYYIRERENVATLLSLSLSRQAVVRIRLL